MATLYVTEFSKPATYPNGVIQVAQMPPLAQQTAVIGTVVSTSAFNAATVLIRVHADAICSIAIGTSPTATTSTLRLAANQTEYFGVSPGDKLSVIANTQANMQMVGYFFSPFGWLIQALGSGGGGGLVNAWLWSDGVSGILWSDGSTVMGVETP